jgi:hypothetical protein
MAAAVETLRGGRKEVALANPVGEMTRLLSELLRGSGQVERAEITC